jgi:AraC-like DNA-binding protein
LRESRRPIGEIAAECGFYDQATFCRQFRAATGLTPGQYRAEA